MDNDAFDRLAQRVDLATGRRSLLGVLGSLGLLSASGLISPDADAKRKKKKKKKPKKKLTCTPVSRAVTCQGRCGSVLNNCRQSVQCGDDCPICTRCGNQGVCDREAEGTPCADEKTCTADGRCECDSALCGSFEVCSGGECVGCAVIGQPCCANDRCQNGAICNFGTCQACGRSGEQCCANQICDPGRACVGQVCKICGDIGQPCCPTGIDCQGSQCIEGTCVA